MSKGKFGFSTAAIAVVAFLFAALRQPQAVLLVVGFALLAEKDDWLNRQALQALLLTLTYYLASLVTDWIFGGLSWFFGWVRLYGMQGVFAQIGSAVDSLLMLALAALCVLAVVRVLRGQEAGLPLLSQIADGDYSTAFRKTPPPNSPSQSPQGVYAGYTSPPRYTPPPVSQPVPQPEPRPVSQQYPAEAAETVGSVCVSCGAVVEEGSRFCTQCGSQIK